MHSGYTCIVSTVQYSNLDTDPGDAAAAESSRTRSDELFMD